MYVSETIRKFFNIDQIKVTQKCLCQEILDRGLEMDLNGITGALLRTLDPEDYFSFVEYLKLNALIRN